MQKRPDSSLALNDRFSKAIDLAIAEFCEDKYVRSPFIFMQNVNARVELVAFENCLIISGLYVDPYSRRKGYASILLQEIVDIADKYSLKCRIYAVPFGRVTGLDKQGLIEWYQRYGFEFHQTESMVREPFKGQEHRIDLAIKYAKTQEKTR